MELDDLKLAWESLDSRVATLEAARLTRPVRRSEGPTRIELALNGLGALLTGSFLYQHGSELRFALPGLLLHLCALLLIGSGVRQVLAYSRLDLAASVTQTQAALLALSTERLRLHRALWWFTPLLWPALALVVAKGCLGWDLYQTPGTPWLLANVLFGLGMIPVGAAIVRRLGRRLIGQELNDALASLEALRRFQAEV